MKKTKFLPLLIVALFASQAWSQQVGKCDYSGVPAYCQWDGPDCHSINNEYAPNIGTPCETLIAACIKDGMLYTGVDEAGFNDANGWGKGLACGAAPQNGTWRAGNDPDRQALGCCDWNDGTTDCWTVWSGTDPSDGEEGTAKVASCNTGSNRFWANIACPTTSLGACPASNPTFDGKALNAGRGDCMSNGQVLFCEYTSETGGCYKQQNMDSDDGEPCATNTEALGCESCEEKINKCKTSSGKLFTGVTNVPTTGDNAHGAGLTCSSLGGTETTVTLPSSNSNGGNSSSSGAVGPPPVSSSSGNGGPIAPIILSHYVGSNTLVAMQNAINLQSTGNATIQIFDLKGNAVRTLRYSQGSYVVPLAGLPKGLYIVKASNASWKKTVKVTVK